MKKYLILVYIFFYINILKSQKVEYGIGVGFGGYFFNHQDKKIFENDLLKPTWRSSGGLLGYVNLYSDYNFQVRTNINLTYKPIVFSYTYQENFGKSITNSMTFNFYSADLSLLGLYSIKINKSHLLPCLGIFYSVNKFLDITFEEKQSSFRVDGSNHVSASTASFSPTINITNEAKANNLGLNAGCFWNFENSRCELFILAYLSPTKFFNDNFEYKSLQTPYYLQGRYHYFLLGSNVRLSKKKKIL